VPFPSEELLEGFSGVVATGGEARAYGLADRAHGIPNTVETQFAAASGAKGLTALVVVSLVEDGVLGLETRARELLDRDLPLIGDDVTVEHLLAHTSGIGDYLDEEQDFDPNDYVMPVPVHRLAATEDYLAVLDGLPPKFAPGERFAYCNSGYVVLALLAERAGGASFHELVEERVCGPAGMRDTAFLRSDELPGRAAIGYLEPDGLRSNVLHLPVRGSGDGGVYTTAADVEALWDAFLGGRIVAAEWVERMTTPRGSGYGLGFWLEPLALAGSDAGVSFRSVQGRYTVLSNTSGGAWPICRLLEG
jgi:CubicO group peptidase (beta-lactamase class C family)